MGRGGWEGGLGGCHAQAFTIVGQALGVCRKGKNGLAGGLPVYHQEGVCRRVGRDVANQGVQDLWRRDGKAGARRREGARTHMCQTHRYGRLLCLVCRWGTRELSVVGVLRDNCPPPLPPRGGKLGAIQLFMWINCVEAVDSTVVCF